jgi:hypothetical protein
LAASGGAPRMTPTQIQKFLHLLHNFDYMMHIISTTQTLTVYRQEAQWNEGLKVLTIDAQTQYTELFLGVKFNYCFEMFSGNVIEYFDAEVVSISNNDQNLVEVLGAGQSGKLSLKFACKPQALLNLLKHEPLTIGKLAERGFNIYLDPVIALEPIEKNSQVLNWLKRIEFEYHSDYVCYAGRSTEGDILIDQDFDVVWNIKDVKELEDQNLRLIKIYNNKQQSQNVMLCRVPALLLFKVDGDSILLKHNGLISLDCGKHIMIGKRRYLTDIPC